ncbi:MAG: DUF4062 domain-containing protein [Mogibacterium sp.]|nr:DUF4062 domain-containing protein [Mogibacterium sp.]
MEWKEVKIFISSTFNDMHAERDYLVTEVFPELSEWCETRRIRLTDIDLRWGVTREDSESGNTVRACLECIDECRPFFVCFLGQRRGWVPDLASGIGEETLEEYETLREKLGSYSMTEMEIEHATLAPMIRILSDGPYKPAWNNALFFFRNDPFRKSAPGKSFLQSVFGAKTPAAAEESVLSEEQRRIYTNAAAADEAGEDRLLEAYKEKIRKELPVCPYDCRWDPGEETAELRPLGDVCKGRLTDFTADGKPLREVILNGLKELIEREYPDNVPVELSDPYDEDTLEQHLLAQTACFEFMGREADLGKISQYLSTGPVAWGNNEGHALFLTAPEGSGKTTLLTKVWQVLRANGIGALYRSVRATNKSWSVRDLYLSLGNEAGLFRASDIAYRNEEYDIDEAFLSRLKEKGFRLLILDGIDRLRDFKTLTEKLEKIPGGFYLILSSDTSEDWGEFLFFYKTMEMQGLETPEERAAFVDHCLRRTLKKLDPEQKNALISVPGADSPLFLKVVLNELKNFGSFVELEQKIQRFGSSAEEAFAEMLRTIELERTGKLFEAGAAAWDTDAGKPASAVGRSVSAASEELVFPTILGMLSFADGGLDENDLVLGLESLGFRGGNARQTIRMIIRRIRPYLARADRRYHIPVSALRDAVRSRYADLERDCRRALATAFEHDLRVFPLPAPGTWQEANGSRELLYHLEMLGDWERIREDLLDDAIYTKIDPYVYWSNYIRYFPYKNGVFFPESGTHGFTKHKSYAQIREFGETIEYRDKGRCGWLADVLCEKANRYLTTMRNDYAEDAAGKLRHSDDQEAFCRYRDLVVETVQLTNLSLMWKNWSMFSCRDNADAGAVRAERDMYSRYLREASGLLRLAAEIASSGKNSDWDRLSPGLVRKATLVFSDKMAIARQILDVDPTDRRLPDGTWLDIAEWS